jgi:hypothetical protein
MMNTLDFPNNVTVHPCFRLYGHLVHLCIRLRPETTTEVEFETDDWLSTHDAEWLLTPIIRDIVSRYSPKQSIKKCTAAILAEIVQELDVMWQCGILWPDPITGRLGIRPKAASLEFQRETDQPILRC